MKKRKWIPAAVLCLAAIVFSVLVVTVDRAPIAPDGSEVGFADFNAKARNAIGTNDAWYRITEILGYAALGVVALFALLGLWQWIRRKSLKKVDPKLFCLGGLYILTGALYVFFEKVVVNVRPVLENGKAEASFPSSHTVLACVVFFSASFLLEDYVKNGVLRSVLAILCGAAAGAAAIGRLFSGVHWATDIIGGMLFSVALLALFSASLDLVPAEEPEKSDEPQAAEAPEETEKPEEK